MQHESFDSLANTLAERGVTAAFAELVDRLGASRDFHRVFEALTLRARYDLGIPLVQTSPSSELPADVRDRYEQRIIEACREVGELFLAAGDLANAHRYLSMIGELDSIRAAIDAYRPEEGARDEAVIEVALGQGVHPVKGLDLMLRRYGICQAISACQGVLGQPLPASTRSDCVRLLVRALHAELVGRLAAEIQQREGGEASAPVATSIPLLLAGRDWLFENDNYHIDTSHLNSVVRLARLLEKCPETFLAIQLCEYGRRLSERYSFPDPPPFEDVYEDSFVFFKVIAGIEVEKGLAHFRAKADNCSIEEASSLPAETFVNLLVRAGRWEEAVEYAGAKLNTVREPVGTCPTINELCQEAGRFDDMARLARARDDLVSFAAALIQRHAASS